MKSSIGLYGGSFDPIHFGHLIAARAVREACDLSQVIFLPAAEPPHKPHRTFAGVAHRLEMVRLALADEPAMALSDYDARRDGHAYTIETVDHFQSSLGDEADVRWIIGSDSLAEIATWHRAGELVDRCCVLTAARATDAPVDWEELEGVLGTERVCRLRAGVVDTPIIGISSTDVRRRIRCNLSVRYLVPERVRVYIDEHGLYQNNSDGAELGGCS